MNSAVVQLDSFDKEQRSVALKELAPARARHQPLERVNLHQHSFFSYNAYGWSPSRIAWESSCNRLWAAGLCDFDVLDGLDEFLAAGELLALRSMVLIETRTFDAALSDVEIDSPGEPGVSYVTGAGFVASPRQGTTAGQFLLRLRETAQRRNRELVARINEHTAPVCIDYDRDVLPLTPSGSATERHIMSAYVAGAAAQYPREAALAGYWAGLLAVPQDQARALLSSRARLEEKARAHLAKRGGVGYEQPTAATFPPVEEFFAWVRSCDAIPLESWLDGFSEGERDAGALLDRSCSRGAAGLTIIPDRNWNVSDTDERRRRIANLEAIVNAAVARGLPVAVGTELNKPGQPLYDDLAGEPLRSFRPVFLQGASILAGHTVTARFAGVSYVGEDALGEFGNDIGKKNDFFAAVGRLGPVDEYTGGWLRDSGMHRAYVSIRDSVRKGAWML